MSQSPVNGGTAFDYSVSIVLKCLQRPHQSCCAGLWPTREGNPIWMKQQLPRLPDILYFPKARNPGKFFVSVFCVLENSKFLNICSHFKKYARRLNSACRLPVFKLCFRKTPGWSALFILGQAWRPLHKKVTGVLTLGWAKERALLEEDKACGRSDQWEISLVGWDSS